MNQTYEQLRQGSNIIASLRAMSPTGRISAREAFLLAERQATRFLELSGVVDGPVPTEAISQLPHIEVQYRDIPTSGLSFWNGCCWIICLNNTEPETRQRFTLLHELKHIIDHRPQATARSAEADALHERLADYFAGCVLMPKRLLKRAWGEGTQRPSELGQLFDVSARAIAVRLDQVGLSEPKTRCLPTSVVDEHRPRYFRQATSSHCIPDLALEAIHDRSR